jgi:hypothetical protein
VRRAREGGRGERPISPFERAVAGLALGGEAFVERIRAWVPGSLPSGVRAGLGELRRLGKAAPEHVEPVVAEVASAARPPRRRRLLLYALRHVRDQCYRK